MGNAGFTFGEKTVNAVKDILVLAHEKKLRVRFWYGDIETGKSWNDEYGVVGTIGRSCGMKKIPLLIQRKNSTGGGGILDECIIKIVNVATKEVLYQHPKFNQPLFEAEIGSDEDGYEAKVMCNAFDCPIYANCKTMKQAVRLAAFMNGERMRK